MRKFIFSVAAIAAVAVTLSLSFLLAAGRAEAAGQTLIRDAEIEHTIRLYAAPLLRAAGMVPEDVRLHIVRDDELNAFVARGQQIFLTTGLLMRAEHPGQVMGVLAHEIGHITGGHLARLEGALRDASETAIIGNIVGVLIGVLAKDAGAGAAGSTAGTSVAERSLMKFSRVQERSADQVAVDLLDQAQISARGMVEFFEILGDQELLTRAVQDPYAVTHPLTADRLIFVQEQVRKSRWSDRPIPEELNVRHARMVSKLEGFINPPGRTLQQYPETDQSVKARYARSVALFRESRIDPAVAVVDGLIAESPDDPYFRELRGQILFEGGRLERALPDYEAAVRMLPREPLLRTGLAHVQIELNRPELLKQALGHLEQAVRYDRFFPLAWRLAAIAYGRDGQLGLSALALAEYNALTGHRTDAIGQAEKAMRLLKEGSPGWLRAQDIVSAARRPKDDQ